MKSLNYFLLGFFLALLSCITLFRWDTDILNVEILGEGAYDYLFDSLYGYIIRLIIVTGFVATFACSIYKLGQDSNDNSNNLLQTT